MPRIRAHPDLKAANMRLRSALLVGLSTFIFAACADPALKPFQFSSDASNAACNLSEHAQPADVVVYAASAYTGRALRLQIDNSGREAMQIDVAVNSPDRPVVLMLGAYEPTIWNVGWSPGTQIRAVFASGYYRQAIAGLEKDVSRLSSWAVGGDKCGYFYPTGEGRAQLEPMARRVFGRTVGKLFEGGNGSVVVGDPLPIGIRLVTSRHSPVSGITGEVPFAGK